MQTVFAVRAPEGRASRLRKAVECTVVWSRQSGVSSLLLQTRPIFPILRTVAEQWAAEEAWHSYLRIGC